MSMSMSMSMSTTCSTKCQLSLSKSTTNATKGTTLQLPLHLSYGPSKLLHQSSLSRQQKLINLHTTAAAAMEGANHEQPPMRCAVVTGANKGLGFETARQVARAGVSVILTARDEKRGMEATSLLHSEGLTNVVFHQLDVQDTHSIQSLATFVRTHFGKLDILVNNAGASGVVVDEEGLRAKNIDPALWLAGKAVSIIQDVMVTTYEAAEVCLATNYYGVKNVTEALLPLLQLSPAARIVNVTSLRAELQRVPSEQRRVVLRDIDTLTEEKIDKMLQEFLHDLKEDKLEQNGWQKMLPAYSISKASVNAYTRLLAKRYPNMYINCVHPGYVNTDINWHTGVLTVAEGAEGLVKLALLPDGGPSGCYFDRTEMAEF